MSKERDTSRIETDEVRPTRAARAYEVVALVEPGPKQSPDLARVHESLPQPRQEPARKPIQGDEWSEIWRVPWNNFVGLFNIKKWIDAGEMLAKVLGLVFVGFLILGAIVYGPAILAILSLLL